MDRSQIEQIEIDAGTAGDLLQAAIAQIALNGSPSETTYLELTRAQQLRLQALCDDSGLWSAERANAVLAHGGRI